MDRFQITKKTSILGMIGNIFLLIIKVIVGFISNSQAMIADAFNSGTDILSSIMTYIGNKVSSKEPDEDHNLGHGKAEYIYSMLISVTMFILGMEILTNSIKSIFVGNNYNFTYWLIIVCVITIIVKLILFIYTDRIAKKYNSLLVKANSKDHRNDCFLTGFNLLASILSFYGIVIVDSIVGIFIAIWIIYTGFTIFKSSYDILMDKTIDDEIKEKVMNIIKLHHEVLKVNHFNATPVGYRYQISFTIFVDGNLSTFKSHEIADSLEDEIDEKIPEIYLTVIHVNPVLINEKEKKYDKIKKVMKK